MKTAQHRCSGFSLVETVIALGLFAFCILPIIGLIPVGVSAARSVSQETQAANLAEAFFGACQVRPTNATNFPIPVMFSNSSVKGVKGIPLEALKKKAGTDQGTFFYSGDGALLTESNEAAMTMNFKIEATSSNSATITLDFFWPRITNSPAVQRRSFTRVIAL